MHNLYKGVNYEYAQCLVLIDTYWSDKKQVSERLTGNKCQINKEEIYQK